ncbi:histone-lysine N-methyltransferase SETMAR [Elysia marginata]|uniref:Histone-lysine N-methyltransferase SETMAR n=1 Tax=Elysia marginata TaxID=1093978 RepID=A0AAV4J8P3_9GAST|nr:histone-lysine N-methyltransferase SETMAR [Elysia marginata]
MATPKKEGSKLEVRAVLRFLFPKVIRPSEIHTLLNTTDSKMATPINDWSKLEGVEISQRLLLRCQQDNGDEDITHIGVGPAGDFRAKNNLIDNLITGDNTWVHLNTPETKRDSMTWKHPSSPVTKKVQSAEQTLHSNGCSARGWEILPLPAQVPDLAPSDFHLFRPSKRRLGGMAFETDGDFVESRREDQQANNIRLKIIPDSLKDPTIAGDVNHTTADTITMRTQYLSDSTQRCLRNHANVWANIAEKDNHES